MKYLGPNAYHEVTDPITGAISWQLDPTSKAIEYSDKDLQTWIEKDEVPHDLATFGLEEIRRSRDEYRCI